MNYIKIDVDLVLAFTQEKLDIIQSQEVEGFPEPERKLAFLEMKEFLLQYKVDVMNYANKT